MFSAQNDSDKSYDVKSSEYGHNQHDNIGIRAVIKKTDRWKISSGAYKKLLYEEYGFDALLSDQISLNRSVPDVRPPYCLNRTPSALLPKTSIIINFYNERRSVLLRTIYGILNRTPDELIEEIILVDDASTWADVLTPLDEYLRLRLPPESSKVRLIRLPVRRGLIVARMEGARSASKKSEAFVFLDSHLEVNYNWLPPLLDPIARNPKACTCPGIDLISFSTFEYHVNTPFRGYFDWYLNYRMRSPEPKNLLDAALNYKEYVVMGGAIAIGVNFFWDLGGFDEGMELWGGEQFELSFKVWMCGGELISVPCSRLGHIFRDPKTKGNRNLYGNYSFIEHNFRRVTEVWMDEEHRQYVFNHRPTIKMVDPGDITERLSIRDRLQCKSFTWMLENVMPDLKDIYPPVTPDDYGNGWIQNMMHTSYYIEMGLNNTVGLKICKKDNQKDGGVQNWHYTWRCEINRNGDMCLESDILNERVRGFSCHHSGGNQKWFYDHVNHWITQVEYNVCMFANVKDATVGLKQCDSTNLAMRWMMGYYNKSASNECMQHKIRGVP